MRVDQNDLGNLQIPGHCLWLTGAPGRIENRFYGKFRNVQAIEQILDAEGASANLRLRIPYVKGTTCHAYDIRVKLSADDEAAALTFLEKISDAQFPDFDASMTEEIMNLDFAQSRLGSGKGTLSCSQEMHSGLAAPLT